MGRELESKTLLFHLAAHRRFCIPFEKFRPTRWDACDTRAIEVPYPTPIEVSCPTPIEVPYPTPIEVPYPIHLEVPYPTTRSGVPYT